MWVRCLVMTTLCQFLGIKDFQVSLASFNTALTTAKCLQAECEVARNPQSCILESSATMCVLVRSDQPFEIGPVSGQSLSTLELRVGMCQR